MIKGFKNSNIYFHGNGFYVGSLSIDDKGLISSITSTNGEGLSVPANLFVVPGFIDEHMHGSDGFDVMDGKRSSLQKIAEGIAKDGVTSFCPTTMTMDETTILNALSNIAEGISKPFVNGARILGAHLEGPFISKVYKGAQEDRFVIPCNVEMMKRFLAVCPHIREVTFAYEENGKSLLPFLVERGIVPSVGHSNCSSALLKEGIDGGITSATHTYNAMSPLKHREAGVVGRVLIDDRVRCELIADLIHVSSEAIEVLYRCKKDRIVLITDSMEAKHLPNGEYSLGGQKVLVKDGAARLSDGTLAGSVLTMNKAVLNAMDVLKISLGEAVDMATFSPAKNLHLENEIGSIAVGLRADFAIIDHECNVYATIKDGEIVYRKEGLEWMK